jgi:hypothetical protein
MDDSMYISAVNGLIGEALKEHTCTPGTAKCPLCAAVQLVRQAALHHSSGTDLAHFWDALSKWSQATFLTDAQRGPIGPLKHLAKEVGEVIQEPSDLEEYVDCLFLVFDACRRAGFTYADLERGVWAKLEKNKLRKWPPCKPDGISEHDHSLDA